MTKDTVNKLVELNKHFYKNIGNSFDDKNQHFREGWDKLNFNKGDSVLDIAAGNYRLYSYLASKNLELGYSALESAPAFIDLYKKKYASLFKLYNLDAISELELIDRKFNIVICFGFLHHLPSTQLRLNWFKEVAKLIKDDGFFIFTTWNFDKLNSFKNSKEEIAGFPKSKMGDSDYFLGWDKVKVYRYCHLYNQTEVETLLLQSGFRLKQSFKADGKNQSSNTYFVAQRI